MVQQLTVYTGPTEADLAQLPDELQSRPQWILWRGKDLINQQTGEIKLTKIPKAPHTLANADTTDPLSWGTVEKCV